MPGELLRGVAGGIGWGAAGVDGPLAVDRGMDRGEWIGLLVESGWGRGEGGWGGLAGERKGTDSRCRLRFTSL